MKLGRFEIKRRNNTVWDYIVPLGLVFLGIIYYEYYSWNCFDCLTGGRVYGGFELQELFLRLIVSVIIFILATMFLSRVQRILIFPWLGFTVVIVGLFLAKKFISGSYFFEVALHIFSWGGLGLGFYAFGGIFFFLGNLILLIKNGRLKSKKYSLQRSLLAWGILGLSLTQIPDNHRCGPITGGVSYCPLISRYDLLNIFTNFIERNSYGHSYHGYRLILIPFLSFVLIGFAVEKYNQRRASL